MKIIISPAKKMQIDADSFAVDAPLFLSQAAVILQALRERSYEELKALWNCSDAIAARSFSQLRALDLARAATPAILAYDGIQYQHMGAAVFDRDELDYIRSRLLIVSGLYGALRPFDAVAPYRLEMQAKLSVDGCANLYTFWRPQLAALFADEPLVVNLASREYADAVLPVLGAHTLIVTCRFFEQKNGKLIETGTLCKMARGEMVHHLAGCRAQDAAPLKSFAQLGFSFCESLSSPSQFVFLKGD